MRVFLWQSDQRPFIIVRVTKTVVEWALILYQGSKENRTSAKISMSNSGTDYSCFWFQNPAHSNTRHIDYMGYSNSNLHLGFYYDGKYIKMNYYYMQLHMDEF